MLYTKSILKESSSADGIRISVMSRHTLNDGVTPDERITPESYDAWFRELAPPAKLIGDYYKRGLSWEEFAGAYMKHLRRSDIGQIVQKLAASSMERDITLLCIEDKVDYCHRRILSEECQMYEPGLEVEHR